MSRFPHLQSELRIGDVRIASRVVSTAHGTLLASDSGVSMSDRGVPGAALASYHEARARGGVGLIITEPTVVFPFSERWMQGWRETIERVNAAGGTIFNQLIYGGRVTSGAEQLRPPYAPSAVAPYPGGDTPQPMSSRHIRMMIDSFANAGAHAAAAGFQGVELHGAHGYLLHQFMSPHANRRDDQYGGSIENRVRFPIEVATAVRAALPAGMVLGMRFSGEEEFVEGLHDTESLEMVQRIVDTGALDYVSVAGGAYRSIDRMIPGMYRGRAVNLDQARQLRQRGVDLPLLLTGRIADPAVANQIIEEGTADLIGMTRALIADPDMPRKAFAGQLDDIRYCMGANEGCWGRVRAKFSVGCVLNPAVGKEGKVARPRSPAVGRIAVVGGGPAGGEAARQLAARGYEVSLFERKQTLGGQIAIAAMASGREDLTEVARWHGHELERLGVQVEFGAEPDLDELVDGGYTHLLLATGSIPILPAGYDEDSVDWLSTEQAVEMKFDPGALTVIWSVSERIDPLSVAVHLADVASPGRDARRIVVASPHEVISKRMDDSTRSSILDRVSATGIELVAGVDLERDDGGGVALRPVWGGKTVSFGEIDTLVLDFGWQARPFTSPIPKDLAVTRIGDCLSPRGLQAAVWDGAKVGQSL